MIEPALLIDGGYVFTADGRGTVFPEGYVLVRGSRIASVGPSASAPGGADRRLDARGCLVIPGLVNTHQHPWYNLFKGLGGGLLLERWIADLLQPTAAALTAADLRASMRLGCLEMLESGTTTCLNHSVTRTGENEVAATLEPVLEMGMRQVFAKEVRPHPLAEELALAEAVHRRWEGAGEGRISVGLVIECTAHWVAMGACSEELVVAGDGLARRLGMVISSHTAGGTMSRERGYLHAVLSAGRTDVEFLQRLGVLDAHWLLAHAINVRDRDIELIATAGASVSHTPTSESSRGGGITPVRRMMDAGIRVGLGTDGPMVDTSVDMVEQMKATLMLQNQLHLDPTAVTPARAVEMATIEAARSIGLGDRIGSLEPGKEADVAVFDLRGPTFAVSHDPVAALVHSGRGRDARWVLVAGEPVIWEGAFTRIERTTVDEVVTEARRRARELLERAEVPAHRRWSVPRAG